MLSNLTIKNFAIIKNSNLNFDLGFNVLIGETGAGKSIILDALNFVLGAKASKILEEIQTIIKDYNTIKNTTKAAQVQYKENAAKYNELKASVKDEKESVEKKLATLENL